MLTHEKETPKGGWKGEEVGEERRGKCRDGNKECNPEPGREKWVRRDPKNVDPELSAVLGEKRTETMVGIECEPDI